MTNKETQGLSLAPGRSHSGMTREETQGPSTPAGALAQDDTHETQGPSTSLRCGRDDKGMADVSGVRARQMNSTNSHPCHQTNVIGITHRLSSESPPAVILSGVAAARKLV